MYVPIFIYVSIHEGLLGYHRHQRRTWPWKIYPPSRWKKAHGNSSEEGRFHRAVVRFFFAASLFFFGDFFSVGETRLSSVGFAWPFFGGLGTDSEILIVDVAQTNQQICKKANKRYRFDAQNGDTAKMSSSNPNTLHYPLGEFQDTSPFPEFYFNFNLKVQECTPYPAVNVILCGLKKCRKPLVGVTYRGDPRAWRSSSKSRSYSNEVPSVTSTLEKTTRTLVTVTQVFSVSFGVAQTRLL